MRLPNGDRCGTPLRRFPARKLLAVAGGVDGVKLCTTLLLSLPPLVLVDKSPSASDVAALPLCCGYFFFDGSVLLSDSEVAVSADDLRVGGGMGLRKQSRSGGMGLR